MFCGEHVPFLNLDVLVEFMSHLPRGSDLLASTSRAMHTAGLPLLLKQDVELSTHTQLSSFCDFILADHSVRARLVRGVGIWCSESEALFHPGVAEKLATVLGQTSNLRRLRIGSTSLDRWLSESPDLLRAFTGLRTVTSVHFHGLKEVTMNLLSQIQSPVEHVCLRTSSTELRADDVVTVLPENLQESLRFVDFEMSHATRLSDRVIFSNVGRLDVTFLDRLQLAPLIHAFPNLITLRCLLDGFETYDLRSRASALGDDAAVVRESNAISQRHDRWRHLQSVRGDTVTLYLAALQADVDLLSLIAWPPEKVGDILHYCRPKRFNMTIIVRNFVEDDVRGKLPQALEEAAADLTHLYVEILQANECSTVIDFVCSCLRSINMRRLVHLTLRTHTFADDDFKSPNDATDAVRAAKPCPVALAQRIVDAVPAVQSAAIGFGRDERSFWRFPRQAAASGGYDRGTPKQISEEEAFSSCIYMGETQDESDFEDDED